MAPKKKTKRRKAYAWFWLDIEGDSSWGYEDAKLPTCVTLGFVHRRPDKRSKVPFWVVMGSWSEEEPGGHTKIPVAMLVKKVPLGWVEIPWR